MVRHSGWVGVTVKNQFVLLHDDCLTQTFPASFSVFEDVMD